VTHAIVLIQAEREALPTLGGALADVEGVAEAYSVTGEWDFAAIVRVREPDGLAEVIRNRIAQLPGIVRTQTMVAFEVFSQHDLEALFSIGS
jgi:DNA-binding Lrp family transcriptional regulator